jgi:hypothetical protein
MLNEKRGLWANIHAKRARGEKPAKPGDPDYPDQEAWDKTVASSKKESIIYQSRALSLEIVESMQPFKLEEAEYQGKKVELGKVKRGGNKKFYVYVKDPATGNVKKVSFGDTTGLSIKTKDPDRRRSFRARHNCDSAKDKTKARYWSCRMWSGPDAVQNMLKK